MSYRGRFVIKIQYEDFRQKLQLQCFVTERVPFRYFERDPVSVIYGSHPPDEHYTTLCGCHAVRSWLRCHFARLFNDIWTSTKTLTISNITRHRNFTLKVISKRLV